MRPFCFVLFFFFKFSASIGKFYYSARRNEEGGFWVLKVIKKGVENGRVV